MKKTSTALLVAAMMGLGGLAQAQTSDVPLQAGEYSTITNGVPNALTTNSPYPDGSSIVLLGEVPVLSTPIVLQSSPMIVESVVVEADNSLIGDPMTAMVAESDIDTTVMGASSQDWQDSSLLSSMNDPTVMGAPPSMTSSVILAPIATADNGPGADYPLDTHHRLMR